MHVLQYIKLYTTFLCVWGRESMDLDHVHRSSN